MSAPARLVFEGDTDQMVMALTFDAGSDVGSAGAILDLLKARGLSASFAPSGQWAETNPALVTRMSAEGHTLINHTYDHPDMRTLDTAERIDQLRRADEVVGRLTGKSTKPYFRPPFGACDTDVLRDIATDGYRYSVMWTVDSLGWKGLAPAEVAARVIGAAGPGVIVLMHVGSASTDFQALPEMLDGLSEAGYEFVTIAELFP